MLFNARISQCFTWSHIEHGFALSKPWALLKENWRSTPYIVTVSSAAFLQVEQNPFLWGQASHSCLRLLLAVAVLAQYLSTSEHGKRDLPLSGARTQEHSSQSVIQETEVTSFSLCHFPGKHLDGVLWTLLHHSCSYLVISQSVSNPRREVGNPSAASASPQTPRASVTTLGGSEQLPE